MATIPLTVVNANTYGKQITYSWLTMAGADDGSPAKLPFGYQQMIVQLGATGGDTHGGATTVLQGSMDGTQWFTLTEKDTASTAISRTTAAILKEVKEKPLYVRPLQTGGTGADIDVILTVR